ncbi:FecR family protein [Tamlana fucoidanivorans]|uniref:FecR family protein n=1 Tax=Allotamlana fucoidanivorans TaxID=2583814 RepID=A0A5C4SQ11_9FLAO|nr:FecR family protein [Tamlana fucoidanivorans]TNJ46083.1 FecR family protein [Tamlana fucoidanivorans]
MSIYKRIFTLARKTAKAISKGEEPKDLKATNLFDAATKSDMLDALNEEAVEYNVKQLQSIDTENDWKKVASQLEPKPKPLIASFYKVAAVLILLISVAYVILTLSPTNEHLKSEESQVLAGTDKAILTLSDGSEIALEKGVPFKNELVQSNGKRLEYHNESTHTFEVFNYLTVPRGGQYQIALSDGTIVWLNADTKLKYPAAFKKGAPRIVELLYGEAFFEVSPSTDPNKDMFQVRTKHQTIEVVGTKFNVKTYSDEPNIVTTLTEGRITLEIDHKTRALKPGDQAILNRQSKRLNITKINTEYATAWMNGYFNFKDKPLKEIMQVLSRWYDVDVHFEDAHLETVKFSGILSKTQHLNDILKGIQITNAITAYDINNKTVTIK